MNCLAPDHKDRRGDRVLLVWGDVPFWMVVDRVAAKFIDALSAGKSPALAVDAAAGADAGFTTERDAADVIAQLKRAGVIGSRHPRPPKERIESISVNVTNRCNLRCKFCYNLERANAGEEISAEQMIRALDSVRRWTVRGSALALLGGEPLLEKEKTLALARWGRKRGLLPIVSTNGLLVDEHFATRAAEVGLDCQVSIDGARPESHDAIRGAGTYDRAIEAVESFVAAGAHTIMSMVFHSRNVGEIADYLRLANRLGASEARFIPIKKIAGGGDYRVPDLAGVIRQVAAVVSAEPELGKLLGRDYVSILAQTCHSCALRQSCGTGSQTFLLDADGTVYPCINLAYPGMAAGNIERELLGRIWCHSEVLAEIRERVRLSAREGTCDQCFVRHWCMGGCRGETYENTGRLDAPSVTCEENRAAILEMFWTLSEHPELLRAGPSYC